MWRFLPYPPSHPNPPPPLPHTRTHTQFAAAAAMAGENLNEEAAKMFEQMGTAQGRVWGEDDARVLRLGAAAARLRQ